MTFTEFRTIINELPVFSLQDIKIHIPDFWDPNLVNWQKKGYIVKITRGYYMLSETAQAINEPIMYGVAQKIYYPSYISLESALAHYNLIPEGVFTYTSVTSRKTTTFETKLSNFSYKHVKPELMFGYTPLSNDKLVGYLAYPEKAILDFLYLHPNYNTPADMHSLRINTDELFARFDEARYEQFTQNFNSKQLQQRARVFIDYWRNPTYAHY